MSLSYEKRKDGIEHYKDAPWIQTYTGKQFHFLDPQDEEIDIIDIAHALSNSCRYTGHTNNFYSVAEHSYWVSRYCSPENSLYGLLHDASEAYIADISSPVKAYLSNYKDMEAKIMKAICRKFGLSEEMPEEVKSIDGRILFDEKHYLLPDCDWGWTMEKLGCPIYCLTPLSAKQMFLMRFSELTGTDWLDTYKKLQDVA